MAFFPFLSYLTPMQATSALTPASCAPYITALINAGGTPMYISRYEHATDYEGEIVACLEWEAAHTLLVSLRASSAGTEVFDICEA